MNLFNKTLRFRNQSRDEVRFVQVYDRQPKKLQPTHDSCPQCPKKGAKPSLSTKEQLSISSPIQAPCQNVINMQINRRHKKLCLNVFIVLTKSDLQDAKLNRVLGIRAFGSALTRVAGRPVSCAESVMQQTKFFMSKNCKTCLPMMPVS